MNRKQGVFFFVTEIFNPNSDQCCCPVTTGLVKSLSTFLVAPLYTEGLQSRLFCRLSNPQLSHLFSIGRALSTRSLSVGFLSVLAFFQEFLVHPISHPGVFAWLPLCWGVSFLNLKEMSLEY